MSIPARLRPLLEAADVQIDGRRHWDLQVHDPAVWTDVLRHGSLGLGDSYVRGAWDCEALDELFTRLLRAGADRTAARLNRLAVWRQTLTERLLNLQSPARSRQAIRQHYDGHPEVYAAMLDPWRIYSCGFWQQASNLNEAQEHKLRLIGDKLQLQPGQRVLDIGCGWGGLAAYLADHYNVSVVGITLSPEQQQTALQLWPDRPLRFLLCDYRSLAQLEEQPFDRVVSVGMYEHVGPRNGHRFFQTVAQSLRDDGLMLLHTIGDRRRARAASHDAWINRHIFPNGRLPAAAELADALGDAFLIEDWHPFGLDYDRTLMAWQANVDRAWPDLEARISADEGAMAAQEFQRFWRYYLLSCAGFFRSRQGQLWQLVLSKATGPLPAGAAGNASPLTRPIPYRSLRPCPRTASGQRVA